MTVVQQEGVIRLRTTMSICPECNRVIHAKIFARGDKVYIGKRCPEHSYFEDLYYGSYYLYKKFTKYARDGRGILNPRFEAESINCPMGCGLCSNHLSHTALANIVVTNRCDLNCWYCLPYDEEILIKEGDEIQLIKIGKLVEESFAGRKKYKAFDGEYVVSKRQIMVLTYDGGKAEWTSVTKMFRRKYRRKTFEIVTKSGRRVRTTEDHQLVVLSKGSLTKKRARDLKVGDRILSVWNIPTSRTRSPIIDLYEELTSALKEVPNRIYVHNVSQVIRELRTDLKQTYSDIAHSWESRGSVPLQTTMNFTSPSNQGSALTSFGLDGANYDLPRHILITEELANLIGYFIGDGHYTYKDVRITAKDDKKLDEILRDIRGLGLSHSVLHLEKYGKARQIVIGNRLLRLIFKHTLSIPPHSYEKRIPPQAFGWPFKLRLALLSGLFNADGFVVIGKGHYSMSIATVSKGLVRDLLYMLASIGVYAEVKRIPKRKFKLAKHDLYKFHISSEDMLRLASMLNLKSSMAEKLRKVGVKGNRVKRVGDFVLDEVAEIKTVEGTKYVYDLEVENESHSFVGGDGILLGNCFFYAEKAGYIYEPTVEEIKKMVRNLRSLKPIRGNAVQLTGGEPTIRDDLVEIIKAIKEEGVDHVQLNTDGINLALKPDLCKQIREAGVNTIYLSFDGVTPQTNPKNYWEIPKAIGNCRGAKLGIVLVPTIIKTVNDHELGDMIRFAFYNMDIIRGVNFQPVSLVGRISKGERERYRITVPDAIKRIEEQTDGQITIDDWYPIPAAMPFSHFVEAWTSRLTYELSNHFVCGAATYVFKEGDKMIPISRFVDIDDLLNFLDERAEEIENGKSKYIIGLKFLTQLNKFVKKEYLPSGLNLTKLLFNIVVKHNYNALGEFHKRSLFLGMMHFMDKYNHDEERVRRCDIHYLIPDGRIIPFCSFNVLPEIYRDVIHRKYGISIEEWERRTGKKLKNDYYHRPSFKYKEGEDLFLRMGLPNRK